MADDADTYTFGDNDLAAERLRILARAFEPTSRAFLTHVRASAYGSAPACIYLAGRLPQPIPQRQNFIHQLLLARPGLTQLFQPPAFARKRVCDLVGTLCDIGRIWIAKIQDRARSS